MKIKIVAVSKFIFTSTYPQLFGWSKREIHFAIVAGLLACMAFSGSANIKHEMSIMGEFNNYPQEELIEWINEKTPKGLS